MDTDAQRLESDADAAAERGRYSDARQFYERALTLRRTSPKDADSAVLNECVLLLQIARMDGLLDDPVAEDHFREALRLADRPELSAMIWYYTGAYCRRRGLTTASFLSHQESVNLAPHDLDVVVRALREQVVALQELDEVPAMLGMLKFLEAAGALSGGSITLSSLDQVVREAPELADFVATLDDPDVLTEVIRDAVLRVDGTVPGFAARFVAGELALEDTRPVAPPDDVPGWELDAEDRVRGAIRDATDPARSWASAGTYFLWRAKPGPALLCYETCRELATDEAEVVIAIRGSVQALADLRSAHEMLACLAELERRGALDGLPGPEEVLAGVPGSRRLLRRLRSDRACRAIRLRVVRRLRAEMPDFDTRFVSGELRFDAPDDVFELVREPRSDPQHSEVGMRGAHRAYRRKWLRRLVIPPVGLVLVGALGWMWLAWSGVLIAAPVIALLAWWWIATVRASARWMRVSGIEAQAARWVAESRDWAGSHAVAVDVLRRFAEDRSPFALFLRSFEGEATQTIVPRRERTTSLDDVMLAGMSPLTHAAGELGNDQEVLTRIGSVSTVETRLADALVPLLPTVAVSNPAGIGRDPASRVPLLELSNDDWELAVRLLVSAAHLIVIECTVLAPGVLTEINLIRRAGRQDDTVVVLPSEATRTELSQMRDLVTRLFTVDTAAFAPFATADHPALRDFHRLVPEDELLHQDLTGIRAFDGLL